MARQPVACRKTGLYYLQSRYYNPEWGRFINADALVSTGQGLLGNNMFAYCLNSPVSRKDMAGTASISQTTGDDTLFDDLIPDNLGMGGAGGGGNFWSSFTRTMQSAANGLNMAMGQRNMSLTEKHHMFSNKNKTYTPQYKEIADRYDYSLNSKDNVIALPGHRGRHTNSYHEFMLMSITELDAIADGNPALFLEGIGVIADFLKANWWLPYAK